MNAVDVITPHDVSPETAIGAILNHGGPILLDLDETLYLSNSTEDFIDSARPPLLALLLMRTLDVVKPWRWTGGEATRDVWRVRLISTCFPWTGNRWKNRVAGLAKNFTNLRLMAALKTPGTTPIITTAGFQPIVAPLVAALGLPQARIVAARLSTFADRRDGKLHLAVGALGDDTVRRALVLTDSAQDLTLLNACARPLRTVWPEAHHRRALSGVYMPGQYLTQIKRPGARYIVRGILQEDFAFWVLSSIALAALPALHVLGLLFLLVSFWAIYERGYVDNDLIAARLEENPKLSKAFLESPVATPRWQPWIWAFACGAIAVVLLRWPANPVPTDFAAWTAVLLATYGWFTMYNRFDKGTRVWMFAGLQFARTAAFVALVPIGLIGAIALGAHVLAKWVPYYVYRLGGKEWPEAPFHLTRLLFFAVLALLLAFSEGLSPLLNWTALALLAWNLFRARQELAAAFTAAKRLDRTGSQPPL
ncbi:MAG TPA: haloacid dehalogenase-like hydrolase [Burkholderiales bacterium]|nr:haloacid dehalogenase-like hydrolase [Burkholderiales bacterium]